VKPVIEACVPKEDVLQGSIDDAIFAADLYVVFGGRAPEVYQDLKKFFDNTYPTEGLRSLFSEVFGRLSGRRAPPEFRSIDWA
jgi:predicted AAA+ superfamily ATPase